MNIKFSKLYWKKIKLGQMIKASSSMENFKCFTDIDLVHNLWPDYRKIKQITIGEIFVLLDLFCVIEPVNKYSSCILVLLDPTTGKKLYLSLIDVHYSIEKEVHKNSKEITELAEEQVLLLFEIIN